MTPEYVTIHNTANDASALNEISYMTTNSNATSYHVAIDDVHAVQAIPFRRNAYHAGDEQGPGNRKSVGIEICYSKSSGPRYYSAEAKAVEYVAGVFKQYGLGIDCINWHRDWSEKHCPYRMIDEGRLETFKKAVKAHLDGTVNVAANPTTAKKEMDEMVELLPNTQREDMKDLLQCAFDEKVFTVNHSSKVDTMTRAQSTDLLISYVARKK